MSVFINTGGGEGSEADADIKTKELYKRFNVNIIKLESKNDDIKDNDNNVLFHVNFEDKIVSNNKQMYRKGFTSKDINDIKNKAGLPKFKNDQFVNILLYGLSNNNNKYNIIYNISKTDNAHYLNIYIEYNTEYFDVNIELIIPAKQSDIDVLKDELKRTKLLLNEAKTDRESLKQEIEANKDELKRTKILLNEAKNDRASLLHEIKTIKDELKKVMILVSETQQKLNESNNDLKKPIVKLKKNNNETNNLEEQGHVVSVVPKIEVEYDITFESNIITDSMDKKDFMKLICKQLKPDIQITRIYSGKNDGFLGETFHAKTDNEQHLLVLILNKFGTIFGGYASKSWKTNQKSEFRADKSAFLYQFHPRKEIFVQKPETGITALYCVKNEMCGWGSDLGITSESNKSKFCWCNPGLKPMYNITNAQQLIGGADDSTDAVIFQLMDIEVFQCN